jgi:hypothetical protein
MNIIIVALITISSALIPFGIGIYKDAKEKMNNLNESIRERKEYEEYLQEIKKTQVKSNSDKKKTPMAHA